VVQDRDQWRVLVNTVLNLRVLKIAGNFLNGCTIGSFSGRAQLRKYVTHLYCIRSEPFCFHTLWNRGERRRFETQILYIRDRTETSLLSSD
jgi:hypothetical protein